MDIDTTVARAATRAAFALALAIVAPTGDALTLHNAIGDDQQREVLRIAIDGGAPVELVVDLDTPEASVKLPVTGDEHRFAITGEAIDRDGGKRTIEGAGVIVTQARLDRIAEKPPAAVDALRAYEAFLSTVRRAAPAEAVAILEPGAKTRATAAEVDAAEKRLGVALPAGYRRLVTEVGAFAFDRGAYVSGRVFAPAALGSPIDLMLADMRDNGHDDAGLAAVRERAQSRFPAAKRDVVLDFFSGSDPTVLVAQGRCADGQVMLAFPESQYELLAVDPGDNPFLGMIDYEDDIRGEAECLSYDRLFAYSLHDHLIELGDEVIYLRDGGTDDAVTVMRAGEDANRLRLALVDYENPNAAQDEADDEGDDDDD